MAERKITSRGNLFDNLPEVLLHNILVPCSPRDGARAAAACKTLRAAHNTELMSHSITSKGSTVDGNIPLPPHYFKKLRLTLHEGGPGTNIDHELWSIAYRLNRDGDMHLVHIEELTINCVDVENTYARNCLQQLLRSLPNLTTLWIGAHDGAEIFPVYCLFLCIRRLGIMISTKSQDLFRLSHMGPYLDTLCLTVHESKDGTCLQLDELPVQPLAMYPNLRHLSINMLTEQHNMPRLASVTSWRHLKLRSDFALDMRVISGLEQLESLYLCDVSITSSASLAQLNVSILTLQSVSVAQAQDQLQQDSSCWPNLKTVNLVGNVSEEILQAMLLTQSAARFVHVQGSYSTFDKFDADYRAMSTSPSS